MRLSDDDKRTRLVDARFVVDATGMRSSFARSMGASRHFLDQLICVTAFFELVGSAGFSRLTMLEAVEHGWWYAAKLPDRRIAVAFASDPMDWNGAGRGRPSGRGARQERFPERTGAADLLPVNSEAFRA